MSQLRALFARWTGAISRCWRRLQHALAAVRPCWLVVLLVTLVSIGFHRAPILAALRFFTEDEGTALRENIALVFALLVFSGCAWYASRALLYVRYYTTPPLAEARYRRLRRRLPRYLGAIPIASLAAAFFREGLIWYALSYLAVGIAGLALIVNRVRMLAALSRLHRFLASLSVFEDDPKDHLAEKLHSGTFRILLGILGVSLLLLVAFVFVSQVTLPRIIGSVQLMLYAAASWVVFGSFVLIYPTYRYRLPSLVALLLIYVTLVGRWNDTHAIRMEESTDSWERQRLVDHFDDWLALRTAGADSFDRPYPVFIVSAEGGGIRAAYWTHVILRHLQEELPQFACHVLAVSGVSGGSLGAAVFAAEIADYVEQNRLRCAGGGSAALDDLPERYREVLSEDFFAPGVAGALFPDLVQRFTPFWALPDRAVYLERSVEVAWRAHTDTDRFGERFRTLWASPDLRYQVPSLFLNGTWVANGGRNVTSNVRLDGEQFSNVDDALDRVAHPIALSTAVHMSARFPFVSPAGRIEYPRASARDPGNDGASTETAVARVVDGGYFDNSGALTATEILRALQQHCRSRRPDPCDQTVRFVAIIISNNPTSPNAGLTDDPRLYGYTGSACTRREPAAGGADAPDLPDAANWLTGIGSPFRAAWGAWLSRGFNAENELRQAATPCSTVRMQLLPLEDIEFPFGYLMSDKARDALDRQASENANVSVIRDMLTPE